MLRYGHEGQQAPQSAQRKHVFKWINNRQKRKYHRVLCVILRVLCDQNKILNSLSQLLLYETNCLPHLHHCYHYIFLFL